MESRLLHVRAAQLRARATRRGLTWVVLATAFLAGALAWARTPERHTPIALTWTAGLLVASTSYLVFGLRLLSRVRDGVLRLWPLVVVAWGLLSLGVVSYLLRW